MRVRAVIALGAVTEQDEVELQGLGLSAQEARAYRALIDLIAADTDVLADTLRIGPAEALRLLRGLEALGLAAPSGGGAGRYVATPPDVALRAMLVQRRDELRRAELVMAELAQTYRRAASGRGVGDLIEIVTGVEATRQRFEQLQQGAEREILAFVQPHPEAVAADDNHAEPAAMERGVHYRVIMERGVLEEPGGVGRTEHAIASGQEIRIAEKLPMKMVVADRKLAMLPMTSSVGNLVVHESGLLDALITLFEWAWVQAGALTLGERGDLADRASPDAVSPMDLKILALLLAGLTDEATAKQLAVSTRTVQRGVRHMMDIAGVTSRLQLGRYAAEHGWA